MTDRKLPTIYLSQSNVDYVQRRFGNGFTSASATLRATPFRDDDVMYEPAKPTCATCSRGEPDTLSDGAPGVACGLYGGRLVDRSGGQRSRIWPVKSLDGYCDEHPEAKRNG